jgi:hypothetical protein
MDSSKETMPRPLVGHCQQLYQQHSLNKQLTPEKSNQVLLMFKRDLRGFISGSFVETVNPEIVEPKKFEMKPPAGPDDLINFLHKIDPLIAKSTKFAKQNPHLHVTMRLHIALEISRLYPPWLGILVDKGYYGSSRDLAFNTPGTILHEVFENLCLPENPEDAKIYMRHFMEMIKTLLEKCLKMFFMKNTSHRFPWMCLRVPPDLFERSPYLRGETPFEGLCEYQASIDPSVFFNPDHLGEKTPGYVAKFYEELTVLSQSPMLNFIEHENLPKYHANQLEILRLKMTQLKNNEESRRLAISKKTRWDQDMKESREVLDLWARTGKVTRQQNRVDAATKRISELDEKNLRIEKMIMTAKKDTPQDVWDLHCLHYGVHYDEFMRKLEKKTPKGSKHPSMVYPHIRFDCPHTNWDCQRLN